MPLLAPALVVLLSCLFAVARRFGLAECSSLWALADRRGGAFDARCFMPGADEFLGPPHALAAQMRLHASRRVPPMVST